MTELLHPEAATDIYNSTLQLLKDGRGVHAETAVAAFAALCGEGLLRACSIDLSQFPQGGFVLVDEISDSGPRLLGYLELVLNDFKISHADDWNAKIPPQNQPKKDPLMLAQDLRPAVSELYRKHRLDYSQSAQATCTALAYLIRDCSQALSPQISVLIANHVLLRAAKSVPLG